MAANGGPTICLNMIVRDEAHVVLEAVEHLAQKRGGEQHDIVVQQEQEQMLCGRAGEGVVAGLQEPVVPERPTWVHDFGHHHRRARRDCWRRAPTAAPRLFRLPRSVARSRGLTDVAS